MGNQSWSSEHTCRQHLADIPFQSGQHPRVRIIRVSVSVLGVGGELHEADEGFSMGDHQSYPRNFL